MRGLIKNFNNTPLPKTKAEKTYSLLRLLTAVAALTLSLLFLLLIRQNSSVAEFVTRNISRFIVYTGGQITSVFSFSVFEFLIIAAIIFLIFFVVLGIRALTKKRYYIVLKGAVVLLVVVLSVFNLYTLSAGFAYYRAELQLDMSEKKYSGDEAVEIGEYFVNDFIYLSDKMTRDEKGVVVSPYSYKELAKLLQQEFKRLDNDYYFPYSPRAKTVSNSWIMASSRFSGVAFLPLGEPNVNYLTPPSDLPHTMAHEIAHTKGVMRENEANLVAHYILLTSQNEYLRYCGYFSCYNSIFSAVALANNYNWDKSKELYNLLPETIGIEANESFLFWLNYKGPLDVIFTFFSTSLDKIGRWFNNLYLKSNGAENGEESYQNNWDIIETDEKDPESGEVIIVPVYSNIHKMLFSIYEKAHS